MTIQSSSEPHLASQVADDHLTQAVGEGLAVHERIRLACARAAETGSSADLDLLGSLLAQRDELFASVSELVLDQAVNGGEIRLVRPEAVSTPPRPVPTPSAPREPPADETALRALVQAALRPNWTDASTEQAPGIRELLHELGAPAAISEPGPVAEQECASLRRAVDGRDRWVRLDQVTHLALLELVVWHARALQEVVEMPKHLFQALSHHANVHRPGFVVGLALSHRPPRGGSWFASARQAWTHAPARARGRAAEAGAGARSGHAAPDRQPVRTHDPKGSPRRPRRHEPRRDPRVASLFAPDAGNLRASDFKRLRRAIRGLDEDPEVAEEPTLPGDWPGFPWTRGKQAVVVGSEEQPLVRERLQRTFELAALDWESDRHDRRVQSLTERVDRGTVDLVIVVQRFVSHAHSNQLVAGCKRAGIPFVGVDSGYGVDAIRRRLEQVIEHRDAPVEE